MDARVFGAMMACPACGKRQHPRIVAFDGAGPSVVECISCGEKGTPSDFGRMTESERTERRREQWRRYYRAHKRECRERNRAYRRSV